MSEDVGQLQRDLALCRQAFYKGAYGSTPVAQSCGVSTRSGGPTVSDLDAALAANQQVIVFLGAFDRQGADCAFQRSDDWITDHVGAVAGHEAILYYQITDEANGATCPEADVVAAMNARRDLINSVDGSKPTYLTLATGGMDWSLFADCADVFGLVTYPVAKNNKGQTRYNEQKIPNVIANAEEAGLERYAAVMQFFGNDFYRLPTPDQLQHQFDQWSESDWTGYMLYHWGLADGDSLTAHQAVITAFNAAH